MTFVTATPPSIISPIRQSNCRTSKDKGTLNYEVGKNTNDEVFVRIYDYIKDDENIKKATHRTEWFAVFDLTQLFILANGQAVSSFEPFDDNSNPLPKISKDKDMSAFLKVILCDAINP